MDLSTVHVGIHKHRKLRSASAAAPAAATARLQRAATRASGPAPAPRSRPSCLKAARCSCSAVSPSAVSATRPGTRTITSSTSATSTPFQRRRHRRSRGAARKPAWPRVPSDGVRILGTGELSKKLTIKAHHFSKSAQEKIAAKGGTAEVIPGPKKPVRNKMKPPQSRRRREQFCSPRPLYSGKRGEKRRQTLHSLRRTVKVATGAGHRAPGHSPAAFLSFSSRDPHCSPSVALAERNHDSFR